eukprot:3484285-Pleurochrysis_carterae.AAC.1
MYTAELKLTTNFTKKDKELRVQARPEPAALPRALASSLAPTHCLALTLSRSQPLALSRVLAMCFLVLSLPLPPPFLFACVTSLCAFARVRRRRSRRSG